MLTNTLPRFIYGKLDTNEFNFRLYRTNIFEAVRGTVCDWKQEYGYGNRWGDDEHRGPGHWNGEPDKEWDWDRMENWKGGYGRPNGNRHY